MRVRVGVSWAVQRVVLVAVEVVAEVGVGDAVVLHPSVPDRAPDDGECHDRAEDERESGLVLEEVHLRHLARLRALVAAELALVAWLKG